MEPTPLSSTERALEAQRFGPLQLRVAILCGLIQFCDGYDLNSVGWAVPALVKAWHLPPLAFTVTFLWSSIGIMVGALVAGPFGDRLGRRPLLLASVAIYTVASLLCAGVTSVPMLAFGRFLTGIGVGGGFSGAGALAGDYASHRQRATMIATTFIGAPLGGFIGGQLAAALMPGYGWPAVFIVGGLIPAVLFVALVIWLPESPRFLATRSVLTTQQVRLLGQLNISGESGQAVDIARGNPVWMLFTQGYAVQTVLIWIIFFTSLANIFLFAYWLPTVLTLTGLTPSQAVFAASIKDFGALFVVLYLGPAIDRAGPERALAANYLSGAVFIAMIALLALPLSALWAAIFMAGLATTGSQTGANGACGKLYPARMRTSGLGWALGIGRLGAVMAPLIGGYLLAEGLAPTHIFLIGSVFSMVAATATASLVYRRKPVEQVAAVETVRF